MKAGMNQEGKYLQDRGGGQAGGWGQTERDEMRVKMKRWRCEDDNDEL